MIYLIGSRLLKIYRYFSLCNTVQCIKSSRMAMGKTKLGARNDDEWWLKFLAMARTIQSQQHSGETSYWALMTLDLCYKFHSFSFIVAAFFPPSKLMKSQKRQLISLTRTNRRKLCCVVLNVINRPSPASLLLFPSHNILMSLFTRSFLATMGDKWWLLGRIWRIEERREGKSDEKLNGFRHNIFFFGTVLD